MSGDKLCNNNKLNMKIQYDENKLSTITSKCKT